MIPSFLKKSSTVAVAAGLLLSSAPGFAAQPSKENIPLEGVSEFPLIFFAVYDNDDSFASIKRLGGTHVHNYKMGKSIGESQEFFDRAARFGLKVMANLDGKRRLETGESPDALKEYVNHFKNHEAMGFWYLYDEPANKVDPKELLPYYKMLKTETPGIPVANGHEWAKGWWSFRGVQDILMNDTYPVTGAPFPEAKLDHQSKFTKAAIGPKNHVIPIIQIMNWRAMAERGASQIRGYDLRELRYPNAAEMRYMCFSSVALGAKGLAFYSYDRSRRLGSAWMEETLPPLLQEIKEFAKAVGYPAVNKVELDSADENVIAGLWKHGGCAWLVVANARPEATVISYPLHSALPKGELAAWGNTRKIEASLKGGILTAELQPWEIAIWEVKEN